MRELIGNFYVISLTKMTKNASDPLSFRRTSLIGNSYNRLSKYFNTLNEPWPERKFMGVEFHGVSNDFGHVLCFYNRSGFI